MRSNIIQPATAEQQARSDERWNFVDALGWTCLYWLAFHVLWRLL